ncbi:hypothetical protein [Inconstantimicrobium mannanitabidum]|uniref:Uncharacterized protein n=1 Tax=Inconstantimicrobium mannanitabidum TaxID=1604901 RepID=A0ACB5RFT0_9CLOT|nr:hypothetical protein [Clostridium sp. TW13]GKX67945.1 hypothetical protein rsdtw13_32030 [Clostridium sp. TW13]
MKKKLLYSVILLVMIIFAVCSLLFAGFGDAIKRSTQINTIEITRRSDSKVLILSDKGTIKKFVDAINNCEKTDGKIDIRANDYFVKIDYKDKTSSEYMLWVGNDNTKGVLMKNDKTWFISEKSNTIFKEILKENTYFTYISREI